MAFLAVGLVLLLVGVALVSNLRGAQDWLLEADERRRDLVGRGSALTEPSRGRVIAIGRLTVAIGFLLLVGGFVAL